MKCEAYDPGMDAPRVHGPIVGHATTVIIAKARGICNGNIGRRQAIREPWHLYKGSYETPFQQFIEERFLIGDSEQVGK